jgi:hypothetical protein
VGAFRGGRRLVVLLDEAEGIFQQETTPGGWRHWHDLLLAAGDPMSSAITLVAASSSSSLPVVLSGAFRSAFNPKRYPNMSVDYGRRGITHKIIDTPSPFATTTAEAVVRSCALQATQLKKLGVSDEAELSRIVAMYSGFNIRTCELVLGNLLRGDTLNPRDTLVDGRHGRMFGNGFENAHRAQQRLFYDLFRKNQTLFAQLGVDAGGVRPNELNDVVRRLAHDSEPALLARMTPLSIEEAMKSWSDAHLLGGAPLSNDAHHGLRLLAKNHHVHIADGPGLVYPTNLVSILACSEHDSEWIPDDAESRRFAIPGMSRVVVEQRKADAHRTLLAQIIVAVAAFCTAFVLHYDGRGSSFVDQTPHWQEVWRAVDQAQQEA